MPSFIRTLFKHAEAPSLEPSGPLHLSSQTEKGPPARGIQHEPYLYLDLRVNCWCHNSRVRRWLGHREILPSRCALRKCRVGIGYMGYASESNVGGIPRQLIFRR